MADDYRYHIDHHGSLVRPAALLAAREAGDADAIAAAENEAIMAAAHAQRRLTLSAVGDGQFRREHFESVAYDHIDGFAPATGEQPLADAAGIRARRRRAAPIDPRPRGRLAQAEAATVLACVDRPVFVALPSPAHLAALGATLAEPADVDALRARGVALAVILRDEIAALAAEGVAYVCLGNPLYAPLLTVAGRARLAGVLDTGSVLDTMIEVDRAVFDGLTVPETFRVGLDLTDSGAVSDPRRGARRPAGHRSVPRPAAFTGAGRGRPRRPVLPRPVRPYPRHALGLRDLVRPGRAGRARPRIARGRPALGRALLDADDG